MLKDKPILLNVDEVMHDRLDGRRWKMRITRSNLIRLAITEYLNRRDEQELAEA